MVLSDQIVVMYQGQIQQVGSAIQNLPPPGQPLRRRHFIGHANFLPITITSGGGSRWEVGRMCSKTPTQSAAQVSLQTGDEPRLFAGVGPCGNRIGSRPAVPFGVVRRVAYLGAAEIEVKASLDFAVVAGIGGKISMPKEQRSSWILSQNLYLQLVFGAK